MSNLKDLINGFTQGYFPHLTEAEQIKMNNLVLKLQNFESNLFSTRNKKNLQCIAYQQHRLLCDGDGADTIVRSHINPENQFKKLEADFTDFSGFSTQTLDVLKGKHIDANLNSGRFVGFCEKCEATFFKNIDANLTPNTRELALSAFRYLGKVIYLNDNTLDFFENIYSGKDNSISKDDLDFFLLSVIHKNLKDYLIEKNFELREAIRQFYELKNYWEKTKLNIQNNSSPSSLMNYKMVRTKDFAVVSQSMIVIPLSFKEIVENVMVFIQFQYDKTNQETLVHLFTYDYYLEQITSFLKPFNLTDSEFAKLFMVFALQNNREVFFAKAHKPVLDDLQDIHSQIKHGSISYNFYDEIQRILFLLRNPKKGKI